MEEQGLKGIEMKGPLVSIQTPVFNQEAYIGETIRSVLRQTYRNWEWIIIDDGSTDKTKEIILSFREKRIRYYRQEHAGIDDICQMHNKALDLARGDFIAFIDGDDLWPEHKLELQVKNFVNDDVVLSYGECCLIDSKGREIDYVKIPDNRNIAANNPLGTALWEFLLRVNSFIYDPTVLVRKASLEKIGGFVVFEGLAHDFATWFTLATEGAFQPLPFCLGYWRKHNQSLTFHHSEYRFRKKIEFVMDFVNRHRDKIELPGFSCGKEEIERGISLRFREYLDRFHYDRAMLLARIGMFGEAREAFGKFLERDRTGKNILINCLFHLSGFLNHDIVNPARKLKEKLIS